MKTNFNTNFKNIVHGLQLSAALAEQAAHILSHPGFYARPCGKGHGLPFARRPAKTSWAERPLPASKLLPEN